MINLDQVRTLEWKVKQAVQLIGHLRKENDTLRGRVSDTEVKLQELESMMESFKAAQSEMESGIRSALEELDHLETDSVSADPLVQDEIVSPVVVIVESITPLYDIEAVEDGGIILHDVEAPANNASSFEAEFAALVEAEEQSDFDDLTSIEVVQDIPDSLELEESSAHNKSNDEDEVAPKPDAQPGLGIF